jgi:hypothetical protein
MTAPFPYLQAWIKPLHSPCFFFVFKLAAAAAGSSGQ